ncbi:dual specificity protein phosphatase family protein [Neorhizobium sp. NPDC001467]|uniref:dual specificity protein phosphatase family protein n=1 Tax=Neorhizobium sp. NPDC001467 TaxID=3390595 RepID=UPI003D023982
MTFRTYACRCGLALATLLMCGGGYLGALQLTENFHEIIPGKFYRSAQPSPEALARYAKQYGIKTVINLRGANPTSDWYQAEIAESEALGLTHIDFRMSSRKQLTAEQSRALVQVMRSAPGPILVHCQAGADRTGLASVMYLQQIAGVDEETAEWQLSPIYGHISLPFLSAYAMDDTWEAFEKLIGLPS